MIESATDIQKGEAVVVEAVEDLSEMTLGDGLVDRVAHVEETRIVVPLIGGNTSLMMVGETGVIEINGMIRDVMTVIGSLKTTAKKKQDGRDRDDARHPSRRGDLKHENRHHREPDSRDRFSRIEADRTQLPKAAVPGPSRPRINLDPDAPDADEEGEEMDDTNEDDAAMMAMMGMAGFGSTKGKVVEGNQEGAASIKKVRTWRQYMNRRGGFNRPLDKIK